MPAKSPKKPGPKLVTASPVGLGTRELAAMLGVDPSVVTRWKAEGCPHLPDGKYLASAVFAWREDRLREKYAGGDKEAEQIRKLRAEADRVEVEVAKARDELIHRDAVRDQMQKDANHVRSVITATPSAWGREMAERFGLDQGAATEFLAEIVNDRLLALQRQEDDDE